MISELVGQGCKKFEKNFQGGSKCDFVVWNEAGSIVGSDLLQKINLFCITSSKQLLNMGVSVVDRQKGQFVDFRSHGCKHLRQNEWPQLSNKG